MTAPLRVGVVSPQPFHMFDLARTLTADGHDVTLVTGTPRWMIPAGAATSIRSKLGPFAVQKGLRRLERVGVYPPRTWLEALESAGRRQLGAWGARHLDGVQVVDAISGWGLELGLHVQARGGAFVCNRGSTHIRHQLDVLRAEYDRWGVEWDQPCPLEVVARELREYEEADAVTVPTRFARDTFVAAGVPGAKVHVCPYGVDLSRFSPRPRRDGRFRVLFAGTASLRKGIGYLLDAVRPLATRGHVDVWLVGSVHRDARSLLARAEGLFEHRGFVPQARLADTYSQASVLVLPSVEEGLALVQAQALACGVPVISTAAAGAEDLLSDGREGFIVPARDAVAIRERLEWMLAHPQEHAQMREAALGRVRAFGGWRDYGRAVVRMYERVARARGATSGPALREGAVA